MSKLCVITGVGEGNGVAMTRRFAAEGYRVAMLARTKSKLDEFEESIEGARGYACDVTNPATVTEVIEQIRMDLGPTDVLIHNAGSGMFKQFSDTTIEDMENSWRIIHLGAAAVRPGRGGGYVEAGLGIDRGHGRNVLLAGRRKLRAFRVLEGRPALTGPVHGAQPRPPEHPRLVHHRGRCDRPSAHTEIVRQRRTRRFLYQGRRYCGGGLLPRAPAPIRLDFRTRSKTLWREVVATRE